MLNKSKSNVVKILLHHMMMCGVFPVFKGEKKGMTIDEQPPHLYNSVEPFSLFHFVNVKV